MAQPPRHDRVEVTDSFEVECENGEIKTIVEKRKVWDRKNGPHYGTPHWYTIDDEEVGYQPSTGICKINDGDEIREYRRIN